MKRYLVHIVYGSLVLGSLAIAPTFANESEDNTSEAVSETTERIVSTIGDPIPGSEHVIYDGSQDIVIKIDDRSVEKESVNFKEKFFSIDRENPYLGQPYTEEEEKILRDNPHLANQPDSMWESRVANCESLYTWDSYFECMFKPWKYGF